MNRHCLLLLLLIIGFCIVACLVIYERHKLDSDMQAALHFSEQRVLRFTYEVANQTAFAIDNAQFSVYLPVMQLSNQRLKKVSASREYVTSQDDIGNQIGQFDLGLLPPFGKKQLSITAVVETAIQPNRVRLENKQRYLLSEPLIEAGHPKIVALAKTLKAETPKASLQKIYEWVSGHIEYVGYVSKDKGALYALEHKKGDCTEYSYLVVALARALSLPARVVGGYVYEQNTTVSAADYHNWAEVYLDGQWNIVDAQNKNFMSHSQHYIAMRVLSDSAISLLGTSHRFLVAEEGLKVDVL